MKVTIDNKEYEIKYNFRTLMVYENKFKQSFEPKLLTDIINFFYAGVIADDVKKGNPTITFDVFLDWLEDNPFILVEFTNWLLGVINANNIATKEQSTKIEKEKEEETVKKKIKS